MLIFRKNEAQQKKFFEIGQAVAEIAKIEFLTATRWCSSCDNLIFYFMSYVQGREVVEVSILTIFGGVESENDIVFGKK